MYARYNIIIILSLYYYNYVVIILCLYVIMVAHVYALRKCDNVICNVLALFCLLSIYGRICKDACNSLALIILGDVNPPVLARRK